MLKTTTTVIKLPTENEEQKNRKEKLKYITYISTKDYAIRSG